MTVDGTDYKFKGARHDHKLAELKGPGGDLLEHLHADTIELLLTNLEDPALYRIMTLLTSNDTITFIP